MLVDEDAERFVIDVKEERRGIKVRGVGEPLSPDELVRNAWALLDQRHRERRGSAIVGNGLIRERRRGDRRHELPAIEMNWLASVTENLSRRAFPS